MNAKEYIEDLRKKNKSQNQSFDALSDFLEKKARERGIPLNGQFELTPLCNLDCRMCYVHLSKEQLHNQPLLPVETWKDLMHQAWEAGMVHAVLTGGECFVYPGLKEIYLYLQSLGCLVTVMTNGLLLDEEWIRFFQEHPPESIKVTLYGADEDTYERVTGRRVFRTVLEHLRLIREAGLPLSINITPSKYLGEDVFETIRTAREYTQDVIINASLFQPNEETGRSGQSDDVDAAFYARILRFRQELYGRHTETIPETQLPAAGGPMHETTECGLNCGGGRSSFVINWKGNMTPCNPLPVESKPLEAGFQEAWKQIHETAVHWPVVPECKGCAYESVCDTCAARMLSYCAPGKCPEKLCEKTRYFVSQGVYRITDCD